MFRRILAISGVLAILFTLFAFSGSASAASTSTTNFASLQNTCAIGGIHLNGAQHTITCLQAHHLSLKPNTTCYAYIFTRNYTRAYCIAKYGYTGVNIYYVNEVDNVGTSDMWIRYYRGGPGIFCTIYPNGYVYFGSGYTNVEITQIDYGASNGGGC